LFLKQMNKEWNDLKSTSKWTLVKCVFYYFFTAWLGPHLYEPLDF
jgi:hypothetical protein